MNKEVMKQALNVLLLVEAEMNCEYGVTESLRQAIAEAEKQEQDEPICRMRVGQDSVTWYDDKGSVTMHVDSSNKVTNNLQPKPQTKEWVGLTNEQIVDLVIKNAGFPTKLAEAIEAKLKQKNNIGVND